jgi:hypothetical protein
MPGNVVVDDVEDLEAKESPLRLPVGWFVGLGAAVVLILVLLPGQPDSPATPTTVTPPTVVVEEDRWVPVNLPGRGGLRDVARLADEAYVAVGEGPQVWRYDGSSAWEWVLPPNPTAGTLVAVTAYADGAVAVGNESVDGTLTEAAIWKADGPGRWQPVSIDPPSPSGLDGVVAMGRRLMAWGWQGSDRQLDPEAKPLVLQSEDGENWSALEAFATGNGSARLLTFTNRLDQWYAAGYAIGRPALWTSAGDLETWTSIDTTDLPFGWGIVDVRWEAIPPDDTSRLVATLAHLSEGRARRWVLGDGDWTPVDGRPRDLVLPVETESETVGVGGGSLWASEEGEWRPLELAGEVAAAVDRVAVGTNFELQPQAWLQDGDENQGTAIPLGAGGRWEPMRELPATDVMGAWQVAGGWVLGGTEEEWTFLGPEGEQTTFPLPWGDTFATIAPLGDEWVALPSMHWTDNGLDWESRAHPWGEGESIPAVEAVAEVEGRLLAVGRDEKFLWNVAVSHDGGHSWAPYDEPAPATPVWNTSGIPDGFVAIAARTGGTEEVVMSRDGRTWEPLTRGRLLVGGGPPAVVTEDGRLILFDTGQEIEPPRADITTVVRAGERLLVVAGGRIWLGRDRWDEIPLDPPHGMGAGRLDPVPLGDRILAVGTGRGQRLLYQWVPQP